MFRFMMVAAALVACVASQAAQYPAGVNPHSCPNFPLCDNAALHGQAAPGGYGPPAAQPWNAQPSWQQPAQQSWQQPAQQSWQQPAQPSWNAQPQPSWNAQPQNQWNNPQWNSPAAPQAAPAAAAQYPAGVDPSACPGYPYCNGIGAGPGSQAPPLPGFTSRLYPAGVNAHSCPNYPICN